MADKWIKGDVMVGVLTSKGGEQHSATDNGTESISFSVQTNNGLKDITVPVRIFADAETGFKGLYQGRPDPFSVVTLQWILGGSSRGGGSWVNGVKAVFGAAEAPAGEVETQDIKVTIAA